MLFILRLSSPTNNLDLCLFNQFCKLVIAPNRKSPFMNQIFEQLAFFGFTESRYEGMTFTQDVLDQWVGAASHALVDQTMPVPSSCLHCAITTTAASQFRNGFEKAVRRHHCCQQPSISQRVSCRVLVICAF